ncbi:MAG TPA: F0F1 ATP synthase subunit epsilon [Beijerinckiaceae bacterium]|jgi:F-type H+-transporting ATPase subunit epsilon|nr:F0F1 ATP synthase subunit epsilon [Beijerinckiaceae bacterium]
MDTFRFELVSPEKLLFSGDVLSVLAPGTEGEFMVLPGHAPLMSVLKPGIVTVEETETKSQRLFVRGGFADVSSNGFTILAEQAIPVDELDTAKIESEIRDAEEDVKDAEGDETRRLAQEKLDQLQEVKEALSL